MDFRRFNTRQSLIVLFWIPVVLIAIMFVAALMAPPSHATEPNADSPVCEAGQTPEIDGCTQGQLPEETDDREIDPVVPPFECEDLTGQYIELVGVFYEILGMTETCEPILSIQPVPPTSPVCEQLFDEYGRIIQGTDCATFTYNQENPQEGDEEQSPIVEEVIDAVEPTNPPTAVRTELASTGPDQGVKLFLLACGLVIAGVGCMFVSDRRSRTDA